MSDDTAVGQCGHVIIVTGVPSAGKTTVADEIENRLPTFRTLSGDSTIRGLNAEAPDTAISLFRRLLNVVETKLEQSNVILDMTLPQAYVIEARARLDTSALFVALLVDEVDRLRRERARDDRPPVQWSSALTALVGPDELYDLVINTSESTPTASAQVVAGAAARKWPYLLM